MWLERHETSRRSRVVSLTHRQFHLAVANPWTFAVVRGAHFTGPTVEWIRLSRAVVRSFARSSPRTFPWKSAKATDIAGKSSSPQAGLIRTNWLSLGWSSKLGCLLLRRLEGQTAECLKGAVESTSHEGLVDLRMLDCLPSDERQPQRIYSKLRVRSIVL